MTSDHADTNGRLKAAPELEDDNSRALLFSTTLYPRRSLSRAQYWRMLAAVTVVCAFAVVRFMIVGAWPVTIFILIDLGALALAFHLSFRQTRQSETLQLTEKDLIVTRTRPSGRSESWRFDPYWCRITLNPTDGGDSNELVLSSHGESLKVGSFLSPSERRALEGKLLSAIAPLKGH